MTVRSARGEQQSAVGSDQAADAVACLPMQAGLVFETASRGRDHYVQQVSITLREPLSAVQLRAAWDHVIARHEALRTEFVLRPSRTPGVRLGQAAAMQISEHDWSSLGIDAARARWQNLIAEDRAAGVGFERAPLMRAALCHLGGGELRVLWTYHHALLDGRSRVQLLHEVFAHVAGRADQSTGAPFRPFAAWVDGQSFGPEARHFWRDLLAGAERATPPPPNLATGHEPPGGPGAAVRTVDPATSDRLRDLAAAAGLPLSVLLQGAFSILLAQEAGDHDLLYATTRAARHSPPFPVDQVVGLLMVTVPVRVRVDETRPFVDLLRDLRDLSRRMRPFEHSPLVDVARQSGIAAGQPLARTMFSFENLTTQAALQSLDPGWHGRTVEVLERPGYGLMVKAYGDPSIALSATWDGVDCRPRAGLRFLVRLVGLLDEIAAVGLERIAGRLATMSRADRVKLSGERDIVAAATNDELAPNLIAAGIERHPERVALSHHGAQVTYGALGARAADIASGLAVLGVTSADRVGVAAARTPDMVAAILAVHHLGAVYVPIDPLYPRERIGFMVQDADLRAVVSDLTSVHGLPPRAGPLLLVDDATGVGAPRPRIARHPTQPADVSHVIYTSGSTGGPKGVVIGHDALAMLTAWAAATFTARDGVLASTSLSFDLSVFEILVTLALGGRVVLVDDLGELVRSGFSERVVHVNTVPSVAAKLLAGRALPPSVRVVTFAGEVLPQDLVRRVMASPGVEQVWNLYGPSEDTTFSTAALCRDRDDAAVPIGRPIRGSQAYVLNEVREPVAVGVRGELHLGGAGLARGYLGLPELTAERFMVNPLDAPSSRLYRTGDIAAWREDGQLEFHGRRDDQVKLRGFRIELEEIRRALLADARLSDAAVALRDEDGRASLAAYVVPTGGETVHLAELRRGLADRLPSHAMPASIVVLDTLPLSPNGKLDLRALAQPTPPPRPARAASLLERELAELWRVMLGLREPPSLDTDFFRCGGDSLDALSLMIAIEDRWRVRLPASAILRAATVTEMAAAIAGERAPTSEHIVPLAVGGPKSPWFCVVAHHEYALGLRRELPGVIGDRSAYSLALLPSGFSQAELDVEALATVGVAQLIAQQPTGPYLLGGYSLGGATAWEMACRLTAAGEEVAQLIIIDTRAPHLCRWLGDVSARARALATRDTVGRLRGCAGILRVSISRSRSWLRAQGAPPITSASQVPIELANSVLAAYTPPRFDGSVVVFRTDATARAAGIETLGWDRHASRPVATRWASGNHFTVLGREQARSLSFDLREVLDRTGL